MLSICSFFVGQKSVVLLDMCTVCIFISVCLFTYIHLSAFVCLFVCLSVYPAAVGNYEQAAP